MVILRQDSIYSLKSKDMPKNDILSRDEIDSLRTVDLFEGTDLHTLTRYAFVAQRLAITQKVSNIVDTSMVSSLASASAYISQSTWLDLGEIDRLSSNIPLQTQVEYLHSFWTESEKRARVLERVALALISVNNKLPWYVCDPDMEQEVWMVNIYLESTLGISYEEQESEEKRLLSLFMWDSWKVD